MIPRSHFAAAVRSVDARRIRRGMNAAVGPVHSERVAARLGLALGIAFTICFVTGLYSHFAQHPSLGFVLPARPVGLYRVTQGLHVVTGHRVDPATPREVVVRISEALPVAAVRRLRRPRRTARDLPARGRVDLHALHGAREHQSLVSVALQLSGHALPNVVHRYRRAHRAHRREVHDDAARHSPVPMRPTPSPWRVPIAAASSPPPSD